MATVFRKSEKGQSEIETRAHRLTPRLRAALIFVDGKRNSDELRAMIPQQADETLAALHDQGFIETVSVAPPAPSPAAIASEKVASAAANANRQRDFESVRRLVVREFTELAGPPGDSMAMRMEKSPDRLTLRALLQTAGEFVAGVRGADAANDFRMRFNARLDA